ncbi:MAG: tetratricopeptide repeat protein [Deltaproteobacteria bacterium]|nr:MAG: tetratricopeptide repeat protein [Deltaproteobacteria bacterium]
MTATAEREPPRPVVVTDREPADAGRHGSLIRLSPGRVVPGTRYRIVRWLGEGGMGVVYEVEHLDIARRAALKVLRVRRNEAPELADKFRDEARAASTIGAENIVEIYDFGELPDGRLMFTMELLDGHALVDEIDDAPMAIPRLLAILRQTARGLAAAHRAGIVHRDVKPENILVCRRDDGRADWVKIVDFGLARFLRGGRVEEHDLAGSPHYMAPEVCLGLPFDGRSDIYALGCVAYELMCGEPPFMDPTVDEVLRSHVSREPVALRERIGDACPRALDALVQRMLAKEPQDRFADAIDLEAAVCEVQLELGIETPWDDLPLPDVAPERREPLLALHHDPSEVLAEGLLARSRRMLVAGAAAAAIGLSAAAYAIVRTPAPTAEAHAPAETLVREAKDAAAAAAFVYPPPEDPEGPTAYRIVRRLERLDEDTEYARQRARQLRTDFATTLVGLGDRYWDLPDGRPFAAEFYTMALLFEPDHPKARQRAFVTPAQLALLAERAERGTFTPAELGAVAFIRPLAEEEDPAEAVERLEATMASVPEVPPSTRRLAERFARSQARRTAPNPATDVRPGAKAGASPEIEDARLAAGAEAADAQAPSGTAGGPKRDPAAARRATREGRRHLAAGRLAEAERAFERALTHDPRSVDAVVGLADVAFERGRYERAAKLLERATRRAPRSGGVWTRLGDAYFRALRYADAERAYRRAVELGYGAARKRLERIEDKLGR